MIRLTDEELNWLGQRGTGGDLRDYDEDDVLTTMDMLPLAVAELRERRAQDLTSEELQALAYVWNCRAPNHMTDRERVALRAFTKLLTLARAIATHEET